MSVHPNPEEKLYDLLDHFHIGMLTTRHGDAYRSRPMGLMNVDDDGALWFFTSRDSQKINEIAQDQEVNVTFSDPAKNTYVSICGTVQVVRDIDKQRKLWKSVAKIWFNEGPEDPDLVMLRVSPSQAEYWDSPTNKMVAFVGLMKALFKHDKNAGGTNETVQLTSP